MVTSVLEPDPGVVIPSDIRTSCDLVQTVMKLQRAAQLITSSLDLDSLLERVVNDLSAAIGDLEISVWLRDPESSQMVLEGLRCIGECRKGTRLEIGREGMVGHVAATGRMHYAPDVEIDPYYLACEPDTRSEASIPLLARGEVIGVFTVKSGRLNAFSDDQLQIFEALAGHIAVAVENTRIFQLERVERARMEREAQEARTLQQGLFPKAFPLMPGFAFEAEWHPAGAVAGDWFDFIDLGHQTWGIVLADVSGKGMPAALLMSATRAVLRSYAKIHRSPGDVLVNLNQTLAEDFPPNKFVTMIYGVLDGASRTFTFASAGHPRPMFVNGNCSFVEVDGGLPLGLKTSRYPEHTIKLSAGTNLLLYSDGITEAMSASYEEYGPLRLLQHFSDPAACVKSLVDEVKHFSRGSDAMDDATALLIRSR